MSGSTRANDGRAVPNLDVISRRPNCGMATMTSVAALNTQRCRSWCKQLSIGGLHRFQRKQGLCCIRLRRPKAKRQELHLLYSSLMIRQSALQRTCQNNWIGRLCSPSPGPPWAKRRTMAQRPPMLSYQLLSIGPGHALSVKIIPRN